jgi:hypothetical protein
MAAIIQPQKWGRIKPALGSQIDWGHPIVAGRRLAACYLLNEGGGRPTELVSSRIATSSNALWTPDGLKCNGTSTATYWTSPAGIPVSPPFTVFALVNMVRNTTAAAICGYTLRGGVGGWEFYYEQFNATGFTGFSKINVSSQNINLALPHRANDGGSRSLRHRSHVLLPQLAEFYVGCWLNPNDGRQLPAWEHRAKRR